jgi:hypothetical protein
MKNSFLLTVVVITSVLFVQCTKNSVPTPPPPPPPDTTYVKPTSIFPGREWKDNQRNVINAHSGGIVYDNGTYYWFGTHKNNVDENTGLTSGGIHGYKSTNLINWDDVGIVMPMATDPASDISVGNRVERSKIVYNASTNKYIAYFTIFPRGTGLTIGYTGVATSNTITGPYIYQGRFLAASATAGTGDFTFFKESNGDLYHVAVRKSDRQLVVAKMTADYLRPEGGDIAGYSNCSGVAISTEAPALLKKDGVYHLLGSGSTGWDPNPPRYYTATNLTGPWTTRSNPLSGTNPINALAGSDKTYGGQSTWLIEIQGGAANRYIAMFDEWRPRAAATSGYIWLPFKVGSNGLISMSWIDSWNMSWY